MKNGAGKNKGNAFERSISKLLSKLISGGESEDFFWRSHSSGGRATQKLKKGENLEGQFGDICATKINGKLFSDNFIIECKHYKEINLWSIITNTESKLLTWWKDLSDIAIKQEKSGVLIAKQNNKPILWICDSDLCDRIITFFGVYPKVTFKYENKDVCIYLFDEILKFDSKVFEAMLKDNNGLYD